MKIPEISSSVRNSLLLLLVPAVVAVMTIAWVLHGMSLDRMARDYMEDRLQEEVAFLEHQIHEVGADLSILDTGEYFEDVFHHAFAIRAEAGTVVSPPQWESALRSVLDMDAEGLLELDGTGDQAPEGVLAFRRVITHAGKPVEIVVAEDLGILHSRHVQLHRWTGIVAVLMIAAMAVAIWVGITVAMRPVRQLGAALRELQAGRNTRIDVRTPAEFRPLVDQLNRLLDTLDQRLERSRQALANLSHSVKTPIAAVRTVLEDETRPLDGKLRRQLASRLSDIDQQLEAEMRRSQFAGPQAGKSGQPVRQARDLLWMFGRLYPDKRFELETEIPGEHRWPVERHDLDELMGNLLDNAGKWASKAVELRLTESDTGYHLCVRDDGPGVEEEVRESLSIRRLRLDEQKPGHGLGLAIVAEIVDRYGGQMSLHNASNGGFCVEIALPCPA